MASDPENTTPQQQLHDVPTPYDSESTISRSGDEFHDKPLDEEEAGDDALTRLETAQSALKPPSVLWKEIAFIAVVCMAQFMTQAGLCMSIAPAHIIGDTFNTTSAGELSWFAAAYSLTVGTFILVAGRLGDVYGHRLMFIIGFSWFGLWSILAGFSVWSNKVFFDCCRALQGIGPAMLLPNAIAILGRAYPPGLRKEMIFSCFGATAPGGFIVGGVFSSLFAQLVWWPWAFWVLGMVCFVLAALGILVIPHTHRPVFKDDLTTWTRLDILGAVTGISGLVLINFAWNQAALVGWPTPYTYALLIVGFVIFGAFVFVERSAPCPLVPSSVLTGDLAWVLGCIAAGWSSFGIIIYYFYQFMEVIKGDTPLLATAKWCAAAPSGAVAALVTGFLLGKLPPSVIMFFAMCFFTAGQAIFATVPLGQTYWAQAFVVSLITSWGMDMSFPSGTLILSNSMHHHHQGLAASLVTTTVNYSISLGLGFAGTVESNVNDGGKNALKGYRGALYLGIGLAALGLVTSICFMSVHWKRYRQGKTA
ncbi:MFS general substrate transporter [Aspergillus heteromorphus CBS 117.55]|uniref:MFS general substrate transporter n=1 Tax=Aspergillus heteromorphus CBS 117.55 TaxID=1448321 RepID=A0A317WSR1_9EURO|nr:MFS general substrate transporter [Aspergillus heteromorphus CBS 117.55]PWY88217.1 MFS general substrate transporter [Aspergillus heteromorphus CBS 117.55]